MDDFRAVIATTEHGRLIFQRAMAHARAAVDNGERVLVTVGPAVEPIQIRQRNFFHGVVLTKISQQVQVDGVRFVLEAWKEHFRLLFLPDTWEMQRLPGQKRAVPVRVRHSTEDLGPKRYSQLIDKVIDHAVLEWGVAFDFNETERDGVRYVAPARAKRTPEAAEA